MIRAFLATLAALPLCGCLAGIAAGTAVGMAASGAGGGVSAETMDPGQILHASGRSPAWAVDIFDEQTIFFSEGETVTETGLRASHSPGEHRYEAGRLSISARHANCEVDGDISLYSLSVEIVFDDRTFHGCGVERPHEAFPTQ